MFNELKIFRCKLHRVPTDTRKTNRDEKTLKRLYASSTDRLKKQINFINQMFHLLIYLFIYLRVWEINISYKPIKRGEIYYNGV